MGKSSRHRSENTFKFQTFSERIANINIDVIRQIRHHDDTPEEISSYFWETLEKQSELNCTEHFTNFRKEISSKVKTMVQLVHHKDVIITALKTHLLVPESMALQALMDLSVALARDLQSDFYPHFQEFFDILVKLLAIYTKDVEILEQIFTCLSYLFKFQWRYLIKDMEPVYLYFSSLLSKKYKEYIRTFAAESFAFLMRKVKDHSVLFDFLLKSLQDHPEKSEGLGQLLFEMIKGVKGQFHSISTKVIPVLLEKLGTPEKQSSKQLPWQHIEVTYKTLFICMMRHADKEHISPVMDLFWGALMTQFEKCRNMKGKKQQNAADGLIRYLKLGKCIVDFKSATVIVKPDKLGQILLQLIEEKSVPEDVGEPLLSLLSSLLTRCCTKIESHTTNRLVSSVFRSQYSVDTIFEFCRSLFNLPVFEKDVLPYLLSFCDQNVTKDTENRDKTLLVVTELILHKSPLIQHGGELESIETYMLDFGKKGQFPSVIESMVKSVNKHTDRHILIKFWIALVCLPHIRPIKTDTLIPHLTKFVTNNIKDCKKLDPEISFVMMQVVVTMIMMEGSSDFYSKISPDLVLDCLLMNTDNINYLRFVDVYFTHAVNQDIDGIATEDKFHKIFPSLEDNLMSPNSLIRVFTLRILTSFKLPGLDSETDSVLDICLCAEMSGATVQTYRDKLRFLRKLEYTEVQRCIPHHRLQQVPLRYLIGSLYINFKLLWQPIKELISSHADRLDKDVFWEVFGKQLSLASENCRSPPVVTNTQTELPEDCNELEELFVTNLDEVTDTDEKPDFTNFRIHLWKSMHLFPEQCEPRSQVFVPLFFDFLKLEYYTKDQAPTQDITRKSKESSAVRGEKTDEEAEDDISDPVVNDTNISEEGASATRLYRTRSSSNQEDIEDDAVKTKNKAQRRRQTHRPFTRSRGPVDTQENTASSEEEGSDNDEETLEEKENFVAFLQKPGICSLKQAADTRFLQKSSDLSQDDEDQQDMADETTAAADDGNNDDNETTTSATDEGNAGGRGRNVGGKGKKAVAATLLVQLGLFGKFRNPMSVHKHEELKEVYYQMLLHRNPGVQKAAFTCFAAYKDEYLVSYKENFQRILDEKTFKNELDMFSIDNTNGVIEPAHRQDVLTILMRILYGRMYSKTGMGSAGRGMGARQSIILRFLNGCHEDELKIFIDQIFEHFQHFVSDNLFSKVKEIRSTLDLTKILSLKKAQSVLSSIELILKKLGHMVDSYLPSIIQITVGLGTLCTVCLEQREKILPYAVNVLKTMRKMAFSRLTEIFTDYETYKWKTTEIDGIFEGIIWRRLAKVSIDGCVRPNAILNFFSVLTSYEIFTDYETYKWKTTEIDGIFEGMIWRRLDKLSSDGCVRPNAILNFFYVLTSYEIFTDYETYKWRTTEIDGIFEGMIWRRLDKLSIDGCVRPNAILNFFSVLTEYHRYFPLLVKHHEADIQSTPINQIIKLLCNPDVTGSVSNVILNMINNLLSDPDEEEIDLTPVPVNHVIPLKEDVPIGVAMLQPHVNSILHFLERRMGSLFGKQSNKQGEILELDILSRISQFVTDASPCKTLVSLLLPVLLKTKSEKSQVDTLSSVQNLLKLVEDRTVFVPTVCRLFATLDQKNSRLLLCQVFSMMCEGSDELQNLANIIEKLNSYDKRRVEEPDYFKRLDGYKSANLLIKSMTKIDRNVCAALINNCFYVINTTEDLSLRDASTNCLITIVTQFSQIDYDDYTYRTVIVECVSTEVKSGLQNKQETIRHEYVTVLISLIDTFGDLPPYTELKQLRDKDLEADFYECIKHIQMHKRARSIQRLIRYLRKNKMNSKTLMSYFVPLITVYLTDSHKKHKALQDAAIDAIGAICKQLPWKHYYFYLDYYIQQISKRPESQKMIVRLIVSVLDAFHFDLSKSTFDMKLSPDMEIKGKDGKESQKELDEIANIPEVKISGDSDDEADNAEHPKLNENMETTRTETVQTDKQACDEDMATKIHFVITRKVVVQLRKVLVKKGSTDDQHKVNKSKYPEDEEILRVPIALAIVKLLQHLPSGALERFLPGVLLKVCNFLRSKSIDIRTTSRNTLIKIQKTLGTRYFPFVLSELKGCLLNGYQRHVLCFTIHKLLVDMSGSLQPGDIDVCLHTLQEILNEELFGDMSEEKDVKAITVKLMEAKTNTSYDSYKLIAAHITKSSLMNLIQPLKDILDGTHKSKIATKVQLVLNSMVKGLVVNKNLTLEHLLVFVHGLVSQTLPLIAEKKEAKEEKKEEVLLEKKPEHSLILQTETPRGGVKPKPVKKTNLHVLVEFGLELLHACHGKEKIKSKKSEHLEMLDPFVTQLRDCLFSKYARVNTFTLRILCWFIKLSLPSLKGNINKIADGLFILLRNHASPGTSRGDNVELLAMIFKAVNVLIRNVEYYKIKAERLVVLLTFCEEDLYDYTRQSTAFTLLKAIMSRKVDLPQIHELMNKLEEMSITADAPLVRRQCRQIIIKYLMDFPLGKRVKKHIEFYISQLSYEYDSGRESALEIMAAMFTSFPQHVLSEYASLFFIPMSANLVNDESAKCRKLTGRAIKTLLTNLDHNVRTNLFSFVLKWFEGMQLQNKMLAAQLCGLFVEVEGQKFEGRLAEILPVLELQLEPGQFKQSDDDTQEHNQDHMIYNTLNTLLKILKECTLVVTDTKWTTTMNVIWDYTEHYLTYPHLWVQLVSCQLFGLLFRSTQPEQIIVGNDDDESKPYLMIDTREKLHKLAEDFISQFQSELLNRELADQVLKNMVYLGKCAKLLEKESRESSEGATRLKDKKNVERTNKGIKEESSEFSLAWLVDKMVKETTDEIVNDRNNTTKRSSVFKWIAAVSLDAGEKTLVPLLNTILPPLQREIDENSNTQDPKLKNLAKEVVEMLKKSVGMETFTEIYSKIQMKRAEKKADRKRRLAQQAVKDPEAAAKKKIKRQEAKKEARKRKILEKKPFKQSKKRKMEHFDKESL